MSRAIPIIVVVVVIILAVALIYLATREQSPEVELPQPATAAAPAAPAATPEPAKVAEGVSVKGAEIEQRDPSGAVQWKVTAGGDLEFDKDQQVATGHDVTFEMVQKGQTPLVVKASQFQANYDAKKLTFSQGVRGHMTDGSGHFNVSRMEYDFGTRKLTGSGGAKFVQGKYVATANSLVVDWKNKKVRMRGGVKFIKTG